MKKIKTLTFLALFCCTVVGTGYFLLQRMTALGVLRWIVQETNLPLQIHDASWDANGKLIWKAIWNQLSFQKNLSLELSKLDFTFDFEKIIQKGHIETSMKLIKTENDWLFELAPRFSEPSHTFPSFQGKISIKLNIIKKITHGIFVKYELESAKPYSLSNAEQSFSVAKWTAQGNVFYKNSSETKFPTHIRFAFSAKDFQFMKDKLWISEPIIDGETDFKISRKQEIQDLLFKVTNPFSLAVSGNFSPNELSKLKINLDAPLETLVEQRLAPWLSPYVELLRRMKISGKFYFEAIAFLQSKSKNILDSLQGKLKLDAKSIELPMKKTTVHNLKLNLPMVYAQHPADPNWGTLRIDQIQLGSIDFYKIALDILLDQSGVDLTTENAQRKDVPIVQNLWGGKIELSDLYTHLDFSGNHEFTAKVKGGPFELGKIQKDFCLAPNKSLDGSMILFYPKIVQTPEGMTLVGDTSFQIFSGTAYIGDLNFDFKGIHPKVKFNLNWNDLDLSKIGEWSNFGDMRGSLEGSLSNAFFEITPYGPIPLSYNFLIKGMPRGGNKIRFYGRSINNILELLGNQRENIPWFGKILLDLSTTWRNWLPAAVEYMGFRAQNDGEWTELNTLDSEEIFEKTKKHYFLYGSAFTIPLNAHGVYPVLMKTDAFQGWLSGMLQYFKERMKNANSEKKPDPEECVPIW